MRAIAWDSWAFLEVALGLDRADEVMELADDVDIVFTTRDIVVETASFLARKPHGTHVALAWWDGLSRSDVRVIDVPLTQIRSWIPDRPLGHLSLPDLSLAYAASQARTSEVATADRGFRALGLEPLFESGRARRG